MVITAPDVHKWTIGKIEVIHSKCSRTSIKDCSFLVSVGGSYLSGDRLEMTCPFRESEWCGLIMPLASKKKTKKKKR